jgi:hypothetical protein
MNTRNALRFAVMIMMSTTVVPACMPAMPVDDAAPDAGAAQSPTSVDEAAVLAGIANGEYRYNPQFVPVNRTAYASAVATTTKINVWVTSADAATYARVTPEASGSGVAITPGTMLLREVIGADGNIAKVTLMVKGPRGYNPTVGDFWFGVTQPDGTPIVADGTRQMGKLDQCFGCHMQRASDGYVFGVPVADRMAPGAGGSGGTGGGGVGTGGSAGGASEGGVGHPDMGGTHGGDVCGDFICGATESCDTCRSDCHCCKGGDKHGTTHMCS